MREHHDGSPAVAGYSSWRWNHTYRPSLRPSGVRPATAHSPNSPSKRGHYAEYVWNTSSPARTNALIPGCSPDQSRQATFSASSCRLVLEVIFNRCHCLIDRGVEVVVEAAAIRRDQRKSHPMRRLYATSASSGRATPRRTPHRGVPDGECCRRSRRRSPSSSDSLRSNQAEHEVIDEHSANARRRDRRSDASPSSVANR